jgi:hypothetical protein
MKYVSSTIKKELPNFQAGKNIDESLDDFFDELNRELDEVF